MIELSWKGVLVVLGIFFGVVLLAPMPTCTARAEFKIDNPVLGASGSYCAEHEWTSVYSLWRRKK